MTAVLLWKEYRQQRAIWLAIVTLAILMVVSLAATFGDGSGLEVFVDSRLRASLVIVLLVMTVSYGLISGALLLVGEGEEGTQAFLDNLTGRRKPLWLNKCFAGFLMTLYLSLVLALFSLVLGFGNWKTALAMPLAGIDALAWGLFGGALCRTVLKAVLLGIFLMMNSWSFSLIVGGSWDIDWWTVGGYKALPAIAAWLASGLIYCRDDLARRQALSGNRGNLLPTYFADLRVLLWLVVRQGRWLLAFSVAGALLVGIAINLEPLAVWVIGSLVIGMACGLAVFASDQNEGNRFLGEQRFPVGRVWAVKIAFWGLAACIMTALAWSVATVAVPTYLAAVAKSGRNSAELAPDMEHWGSPTYWMLKWTTGSHDEKLLDPFWFLGLWPLYGFCFGQFFGLIARRPVIAFFLAIVITPFVVGVWIPSLFFGGVSNWWFFPIPIVLLLATRLAMRPWLASRLATRRPVLGMTAAGVSVLFTLAGFCWHRAVEVPDVGEPFDMAAFEAELANAKKNEAGPLLRRAKADLQALAKPVPYRDGHMDEKNLDSQLDRVFESEWAKEAEKAAHLPLGVVVDLNDQILTGLKGRDNYYPMAALFVARARQLRERGDAQGALSHLETALALSRQVRNYAASGVSSNSSEMEVAALSGFYGWLNEVGPQKGLLKAALTALQNHEAARPNAENNIKAQFLLARNLQPQAFKGNTLVQVLRNTFYHVPWENQRQSRILDACTVGQLRQARKPFAEFSYTGLPLEDGPGSSLTERQWDEFRRRSWASSWLHMFWHARDADRLSQRNLHMSEVFVAVALYHLDHGVLPAKLEDLVPRYLATLPVDSITGEPFAFAISAGEYGLDPGRAYIYCRGEREQTRWPVPAWAK